MVLILLVIGLVCSDHIPESQEFEPKIIPNNVSGARQALNYDKYASRPVESSKSPTQKFKYGNNWEDFDTPEIHYNFGYPNQGK